MAHRVLIINGKEPDAGVGGVSDADFSHVSNRFLTEGIVSDGDYEVEAQLTPDMTVKVNAGSAYVSNPAGTMLYPTELPTADNVTITANNSGNDRIDAIVIKIDTSATPDEHAENVISLVAVAGTAAASPVAPTDSEIQTSVGAGNAWLKLAEVTVENATVSITGADISDARVTVTWALSPVETVETGDGWTESADTWVYASASTFTIAGVDRTAVYTKGTRIKFSQTTTKYGVVVSSSFSTNTTVTIAVNTDYTIANAAITAPHYSYQANPQGYPGWFSFTPTYSSAGGAFSNAPATTAAKWMIIGNTMFIVVNLTYHASSGGSGATQISGIPATPANHGGGFGRSYSNGWMCNVYFQSGVTRMDFDKYDGTTAIGNSINMIVEGYAQF